uniref:50S ribosomal protein L25 n=1 Tax=Talaromyces marneffei PM1 TaxID=1077442 RepID=A0A093UYB5_TALMA
MPILLHLDQLARSVRLFHPVSYLAAVIMDIKEALDVIRPSSTTATMDMPGKPIGNSTGGTKVTTDPASSIPHQEGPGAVTNDSLAGESVRQGGAFSQNPNSEPLSVSGSNSTFNNTDTSGATTLRSAAQAADRDIDRKERYPDALGGQGQYPGAHIPESGYAGGSTQAKRELGIGGHQHQYNTTERAAAAEAGGSAGFRSEHNGGTAPSYITPVVQNVGNTKPNGVNIKEGGFDSNPKNNASFNSDIGTNMDPGRLAEQKFQKYTAQSGANAGYTNPTVDANQPYGNLGSDQRI